MNPIETCDRVYKPPVVGVLPVRCTFLKDHPDDRCSWWALRTSYEAAAAECDDTPPEIQVFLDAINEGRADAYLEAILAAGHARKRSLRGVRLPYGVRRD